MLSFPRRLFSVLALSTLLTFQVHAANSSDPSTIYSKLPPFKPGLWWSSSKSGHGFDIQYAGNIVFVVLYTYDENGDPIWFTAEAPLEDKQLDTEFLKHRWNNESHKQDGFEREGRLQLEVQNPYKIKATVKLNESYTELELEPFAQSNISQDEPKTGLWYNPDNSGYGFTYVEQQRWKFGLYYYYDSEGNPTWLYGSNNGTQDAISFQRFEGSCLSCPDKQSTGYDAGSAAFSFSGETQGNINIQLNQEGPWELQNIPIKMLTKSESQLPSFNALSRFNNDDDLASYLREGYLHLSKNIALDFSPAPTTSSSPAISNTNLQEHGVDEIDFLKTDTKCAFTYPSEKALTINSYSLDTDGKITARKQFTKQDLTPNPGDSVESNYFDLGLYLREDDLTSISSTRIVFYGDAWIQDELWQGGHTFIDIHQREQCELSEPQRITLSGYTISSRRINNQLYIMWRSVPSIGRVIWTLEDENELREELSTLQLNDLIPKIKIGNQEWKPVVDHKSSYVLANQELPASNFIMLTRINLEQADDVRTISISGHTETIYVSNNAAYIVSNSQGYRVPTQNHSYNYAFSTQIHKFNLDQNLSYAGSGSVDGYLEGGANVTPFRLSEKDGDLAVVTRFSGGGSSQYKLSILTPSEKRPGLMVYKSHLPNKKRPQAIGKVDERLQSTRFVNNKLYAVTFRQIDPLYVINMENHNDPFIEGVLEVPGFSSYLHPLPNDKLLGVGRASDDQGNESGNQVSLFDISNPKVPALLKNIIVGKSGSRSAAENNHHGFSYLPGDNVRNARFAIPMMLRERVSNGVGTQNQWLSSGLYQFEFNSDFSDVTMIQDLTTHKPSGDPLKDNKVQHSALNGRSTLFENQLIYYEGGRLWGAKWGDNVPDYVPSGN